MMRLVAFAVIGWSMSLLSDGEADRTGPADTGRSGPMAQVGQDGTEGPVGADSAEAAGPTVEPNQTTYDPLSEFAKSPLAIFFDSFDRPDNDDISATALGQAGLLAPLPHVEPGDGGDPAQSRIAEGKLLLGNNSDSTPGCHVVLNRNINFAEIIDLGGFSVSLRVENVAAPDSSADLNDSWVGCGVGLNAAALVDTTANHVQQKADFFLALTAGDNLRVFQRGTQVGEDISVGDPSKPPGRTIRAKFVFESFEAGAKVNYQLFSDGTLVGSGKFTWGRSAKNYIGLDTASGGSVNNFLIAMPGAVRERCVKPGWLDDQARRKPQTSLLARVLHMVETAGHVDPDGEMHQKLSEGQLKMVRNTLLEIDYDMQRLLGGDPTIAERDPKKDPLKSPWLTDEDKRELLQKRTLLRPKPEPPFAKTPGIELKDKEERVVHIKDGTAQNHSRAVNTGTRNSHGTVIYRAGGNRGSARGGIRPRVINIPPPRKPTPPPSRPEPDPADASNG